MNSPDNPKILHLIHGLTVGGAEVELLNKATVLIRDYGYEITIGCLMRRGPLAEQAEAAGVKVVGPLMRQRSWMNQRYDVLAARQIRRLMMYEPWSVIHSHLFAANLISAVLLNTLPRAQRPPLLVAEHSMAERWGKKKLWLDRFIQHQSVLFLVPSQASADSYLAQGLQPDKLRVLSNGIDLARFVQVDREQARIETRQTLNISPQDYLLGTVCRLEAIKNLPLLLEAMHSLEELLLRLIIVGEGPERPHLEALIESHQLADRVQLLGRRADVPQLLAAMDLFVLPSLSESFGIAVAEALLMETPVVSSRVGGISGVTNGDECATLVPPNDLSALVDGIRWAMNHAEIAHQQAQTGKRFVENKMSIDAVANVQHKLYQQLIRNGE